MIYAYSLRGYRKNNEIFTFFYRYCLQFIAVYIKIG